MADSTSSKKGCAFEATGLPNDRCKFLPLQETKATASLMFAENLGSVSNQRITLPPPNPYWLLVGGEQIHCGLVLFHRKIFVETNSQILEAS